MVKNETYHWDPLALKLYRQFMESVQAEVRTKHLEAVAVTIEGEGDQPGKNFTYEQNFLLKKLEGFNELVYVSLDGETTSMMKFADLMQVKESNISSGFHWWPAHFQSMNAMKEWLYSEEPI